MNFTRTTGTGQIKNKLDHYFKKLQEKKASYPTQIRVYSATSDFDFEFPAGSSNRRFHIASVGKVFTTVLIMKLKERGAFTLDDPIHSFFPNGYLDRLFTFKGTDYQKNVTIRQLLGHTSGIADYFEGQVTSGKSMLIDVLENTNTHWTPQMLIDFTRDRQVAVSAPGLKYNYSDTGYILLGLLIEKVTGKSFGRNLEDEFFHPLEMADSYLMFYTRPSKNEDQPIEPIWLGNIEVSRFESLSCDWAGGGIISTTADLLKFNRALREARLIQPTSLAEMDVCPNRFRQGIYYGLGMMGIRFREFFFLLGYLPEVKGHIGILSTHMFYNPVKDAHIVMNFGSTSRMEESFRALIEIENLLPARHCHFL